MNIVLTLSLGLIFIFICVILIYEFLKHDKGPDEPVLALWTAFGFGFLALAITSILSALFVDSDYLEIESLQFGLAESIKVGFIEELSKFAPLALFIYSKKYFNEHNDGIIYFAICGLTFGVVENLLYTFSYGFGTGFARLFLIPFFHGATASIVGYYLAKKKIDNESWIKVVIAFTAVSLLHALYNFGYISQMIPLVLLSFAISIGFTISIFLYYAKSNREDRLEGISASGPDNFCTRCGLTNKNDTLFCEKCGLKF